MIIPCCKLEAGGDQENVMFLSSGMTVKLCGGPVGTEDKRVLNAIARWPSNMGGKRLLYRFIFMQALPAKEGEGEMRVETKLIASDNHALILISIQFLLHNYTVRCSYVCSNTGPHHSN